MPKYVPIHHPLCSCELCMLHRASIIENVNPEETRRRAVAWMNRHGKDTFTREPGMEMDSLVGKPVRFQWAHRQPDLTGSNDSETWNASGNGVVLAVDRGAALVKIDDVAARWWPFRSFAWIEVEAFEAS